jgi:hypothetical protein
MCLCVSVAGAIQPVKHMRRIALSSVASLVLPHFSTVSHKRHDFREKVTEHNVPVLTFSTNIVCDICCYKTHSARYCHNCVSVFMQSTRYSCQILMKPEFSRQIFKNTRILNLMKIRPVAVDLFHADGQTDGHDEANSRSSQLWERT